MITAASLYSQANVTPEAFGINIVPPEVQGYEARKQLVLDYLETVIIPAANSEVSVPFTRASSGSGLPLSCEVILRRYPSIGIIGCDRVNEGLQLLYDEAVKSYARSEINKQVSSNSKSYDDDSDQDRKFADDKLDKLISSVQDIVTGESDIIDITPADLNAQNTQSVKTVFYF